MLGYFAPESLLQKVYSFQSDVWQAGVILYAALSGLPAFPNDDYIKFNGTFMPMTGSGWNTISGSAKDLVARMLDKNVSTRICVDEVLVHPWINGMAPVDIFGIDYSKRVKGLALRQKLKLFFLDHDIVRNIFYCVKSQIVLCFCLIY